MALFDMCVNLHPHQIEAALFALRSPLSKGVILADEVGLGKTIEAGLVICQCWAEGKRTLLVICPASLRKQWSLEIEEKLTFRQLILDARAYRIAQQDGKPQPFQADGVVNDALDRWFEKQGYSTRDLEYGLVYVNGDNNLENLRRADQTWKVRLTEEEFQRVMFDLEDV